MQVAPPKMLVLGLCTLTLAVAPALAEVQIQTLDPGQAVTFSSIEPAEDSAKELAQGHALILPFYRVDTQRTDGETTLYALRNNSSSSVTVRLSYYGAVETQPWKVEQTTIAAHAVYAINLRFVDGLPQGGVSSGFMVAEVLGSQAQISPLSGDYFRVDRAGAAANGGDLVPIEETGCRRWSHRFLSGGAFSGGTRIAFLALDRPAQGTTVMGKVYNDQGQLVSMLSLHSDEAAFEISDRDLNLVANAGSIDWVFQGGSHGTVSSTFSASGIFSVGAEATCTDGQELPPGSALFELPGNFLTCNGCGNWQYDMPLGQTRQFSKVIVDFEVFIAGWDPARTNGFHCIFWLNNGTRWQEMMGYLNSRGTMNRTVFQSNGPLGNPIGVETYASPGLQVGQTYQVHYEYDTVNKGVWYEVRNSDGSVQVSDYITLPDSVGKLVTNYTFVQFGSQPGGVVESLTEGWRWSNFRAVFLP